jgi:hypothetical protein
MRLISSRDMPSRDMPDKACCFPLRSNTEDHGRWSGGGAGQGAPAHRTAPGFVAAGDRLVLFGGYGDSGGQAVDRVYSCAESNPACAGKP